MKIRENNRINLRLIKTLNVKERQKHIMIWRDVIIMSNQNS